MIIRFVTTISFIHMEMIIMSIQYISSIDIWCLGSNLVTPHKVAPCSAQQGVGSDNTNFPHREM